MPFTTKIEIVFDRKHIAPDDDIQFYRVYRKKNAVPDRIRSELTFIVNHPFFPENLEDTIVRLDSQLPQIGISYDPLEQIDEIDPRGAHYKIAIDDSVPIPPTNLIVIPDPNDNISDIGGILIQWTAAVPVGTIWGYDITAIDSGGLESPEGAELHPFETSKLETINIGLADGVIPAPSEYPLAGQIFNTYVIEGGSQTFTVNNQTSIVDDNGGTGWDTDGPMGVTGQSALSDFPNEQIILKWSEALKSLGTDMSSLRFRVTAFTKAGYSSTSIEIPGPSSVITPITNGNAGVSITKVDATRWHDGITPKNAPSPPAEIIDVPNIIDGIINLAHGSIIKGSVFVTDTTGQIIYVEDSGSYNSPNNDGDYIIDYSRINGLFDVGGRIKILNSGIINPLQRLHVQYKFGLDFGTGPISLRPTLADNFVGPYNGTIWSGTGLQTFTDTEVESESVYNYAWFVTDNAGRTTQNGEIKYAQGILQDVIFPSAITGFKVEAILQP